MAIDYTMPKLAMAMNEGTINEWLVEEGDYVEKGQPLATIETEKVAYDVESPEAGYFHLLVKAGETVNCEALIAQFAQSEDELVELQSADASVGKAVAANAANDAPAQLISANSSARAPGNRIKASPLARKLARDAGLDLCDIIGTGPGGRIVKRDILSARERPVTGPSTVPGSAQVLARLPMDGTRRSIANRMVKSLQDTAQLSSAWESDITDLIQMRKSFTDRAEQLGTRVSMNAFIVRALVYALRQVPIANSCLEGDEIVIYDNVNLGVAISVPASSPYDSGLMVGVLPNVQHMGVVELDIAMKALVQRVRTGAATPEDLTGSTVTLSSTAGIAPPGMTTTPVLNSPNSTLLGPSTPMEKPVSLDGKVAIRTMLPLSFTFDHRVLDGEPAARFMSYLHEALEHPELMLA